MSVFRRSNVIHVAECHEEDLDSDDKVSKEFDEESTDYGTNPQATSRVRACPTAQCSDKTRLYTLFKPLLMCMKLSGLYYVNTNHARKGFRLSLGQAYCMFITTFVTLNFARSLSAFSAKDKFGTILFFKCILSIWYLEATLKACISVYLATAKGGLYSYFIYYETNIASENCDRYSKTVMKWQVRALVNSGVFIICSTVGTAYCIFGPEELRELLQVAYLSNKKLYVCMYV